MLHLLWESTYAMALGMHICDCCVCHWCSIMLNILGEGSGAEGEQTSEQLMARAMQVSST